MLIKTLLLALQCCIFSILAIEYNVFQQEEFMQFDKVKATSVANSDALCSVYSTDCTECGKASEACQIYNDNLQCIFVNKNSWVTGGYAFYEEAGTCWAIRTSKFFSHSTAYNVIPTPVQIENYDCQSLYLQDETSQTLIQTDFVHQAQTYQQCVPSCLQYTSGIETKENIGGKDVTHCVNCEAGEHKCFEYDTHIKPVECMYDQSGYGNYTANVASLAGLNTLAAVTRSQYLGGSDSFSCTTATTRTGTLTKSIYIDPSVSESEDCFDITKCDGSLALPYSNIAYFLVHLHNEEKINEFEEAVITIQLMKGTHYFIDGLLQSDNTNYYFKVNTDGGGAPNIDPIIFRAFERISATACLYRWDLH